MAGLGNRAGEKGKELPPGQYGGVGDPSIIVEADVRREDLS